MKDESENTFRNVISESDEDESKESYEKTSRKGTSTKPTMPVSISERGSSSRINLQDKAMRNQAFKEWLEIVFFQT